MSEPKFRAGDIVIARGSEGYFPEREVISVSEDGSELCFNGILCGMASYGYDLVYRPANRLETEALRRVAKAACDYQEAHDSYFEEAEAWVAAGRPKDYPVSRLTPTFRAMLKECRLITDPNNEKFHEEL